MTTLNLNRAQRRKLKALHGDFIFYSKSCLRIRTKSGKILPFTLNRAQRYIHECIEAQRAKTGMVRALILKGRQQGCSTYVEGRFYWRTSGSKGLRAFILSHEADSANALFNMAKRYHDECPEALRPIASVSNRQELVFGEQSCSYRVATAGNEGAGRGETIQLFHGSEVAFWKNGEEIAAGALQAVPNEPGTEIILESTANGMGNYFHQQWKLAEKGDSAFIAIFVPWFWQDEYSMQAPEDFSLTPEEVDYQTVHGVSFEHMVWRRFKVAELGINKFRQEYPATAAEAFETSAEDAMMPPEVIMKARKGVVQRPYGPLIGGLDPAGDGIKGDRTVIAIRQGRQFHKYSVKRGLDTMEVVGWAGRIFKEWGLQKLFVDNIGIGAGVYDRMRELGYDVTNVNAGVVADDERKYVNKRAEMWGELADWLHDSPVSIPDEDEVQADLTTAIRLYDSNSRFKLLGKKEIRKQFGFSPDIGEALALTFAYPVAFDHEGNFANEDIETEDFENSNPWMRG